MKPNFLAWFVLAGLGFGALSRLHGGESIAVVRVAEGERMVHVVASPFTHEYYQPRLEAMLLHRYAPFGLKYRRVKSSLAELAGNLDALVLVHRPSLVMIQTGNWDLVRLRHYEFTEYPKHLEHVAARLAEKRIRMIICSPIPIGSDSRKGQLVFPVDELSRWAGAARQIAARHGAPFVDLFSDAIEWKVPGSTRAANYYSAEQHRDSFELLRRQLRFEPSATTVTVDAKARTVNSDLARIRDVTWGVQGIALTIEPVLGEGSLVLRVQGLAPGNVSIEIDDRASPGVRSTSDLESGIELGLKPKPPPDLRALQAEIDRGQDLAAALTQIHDYGLPEWLTLADFAAQKSAALNEVVGKLEMQDARFAEQLRPSSLRIKISPDISRLR